MLSSLYSFPLPLSLYAGSIVWFAGIVQTALYCDFFYHYYESKRGGLNRPVKLPV